MTQFYFPDSLSKNTQKLLGLYNLFPFYYHPLWQAVIKGRLTKEQVMKAEGQHYLRTSKGRILRKEAMQQCAGNPTLWTAIIDTYIEECTEDDGTPTHLDLIERFLSEGGCTKKQINQLTNTPGNTAAIALYRDISVRGAGCHIIGAGMVEYYYSQLCPSIFHAYTHLYNFSEFAAETYKIHGTMDEVHAMRAFEVVDEAIKIYGWDVVTSSVRDAFIATSLHYDGMLQAAVGENNYWNGKY